LILSLNVGYCRC